ncbi:MAG: hypothetical protein AB7U43_08875 [Desulfobacter sp.]
MLSWIFENWLALLGAVTGSVALLINYLSYRHSKNKEDISLAVSCAAHPRQTENLRAFAETETAEPWNRISMVEIYTVTVRNRGSITAPLSKVGVVTSSGVERTALVRKGQYMEEATGSSIDYLPPKSERIFDIYLKRDEEFYSLSKAFVIDQTGKRWEVNA